MHAALYTSIQRLAMRVLQVGVWYAICHLSGDLQCESCRWVCAVLYVTYSATCSASLVGGCVLCYMSPIWRLAVRVLQVGVWYAICHLSSDLQCESCRCVCAVLYAPFQPTEPSILEKLRRKQGERYSHFSPSWYSTYPWLTICTTKGKAFCVYCQYCSGKQLLNLAKKGEDAFVDSGFDN